MSLPGNRAATLIFLWIIQEIQPVVLVVFFIIDVLIVYDLKPCTEEVVPFLRRLIPKDHSIVEKIPGNDLNIPFFDLHSGEIGV